ncbi:MAG: RNA polymerase sigma factor [Verrucomicrobiota bacterium]
MSDQTDRLCRRAKAGDSQAASELVTQFYRRIFCYLCRLCGDETEAADLTQKTFLKLWDALPGFEGRSSFSTWLYGIAHHVYLDWRRKPQRDDARASAWWEARADDARTPFESAEQRDLAFRLYAAVEHLDEPVRDVVHLHYYQGLSLSETAEALGIAVSTVKYRIQSALELLRARVPDSRSSALTVPSKTP